MLTTILTCSFILKVTIWSFLDEECTSATSPPHLFLVMRKKKLSSGIGTTSGDVPSLSKNNMAAEKSCHLSFCIPITLADYPHPSFQEPIPSVIVAPTLREKFVTTKLQ